MQALRGADRAAATSDSPGRAKPQPDEGRIGRGCFRQPPCGGGAARPSWSCKRALLVGRGDLRLLRRRIAAGSGGLFVPLLAEEVVDLADQVDLLRQGVNGRGYPGLGEPGSVYAQVGIGVLCLTEGRLEQLGLLHPRYARNGRQLGKVAASDRHHSQMTGEEG